MEHAFPQGVHNRNTSTINHSMINWSRGYHADINPGLWEFPKGTIHFNWSERHCKKLHIGDNTHIGLYRSSLENVISRSSGFEHTHKVLPNLIPARSINMNREKLKGTKKLYFRKVSWSHIRMPGLIKQFVNVKLDCHRN